MLPFFPLLGDYCFTLNIFPLSGTAVLEQSVHISVIQAQWASHQQQHCYASPIDSFHLSILSFLPLSSISFLLTFAEDPAFTSLRYQDADSTILLKENKESAIVFLR